MQSFGTCELQTFVLIKYQLFIYHFFAAYTINLSSLFTKFICIFARKQKETMYTLSHPWHGIPTGANSPRLVNAIIEIPQGSRCKYEIDKESGLLMLDRVIYSSFYYPCNYGFIPQTYGGDKDPLDILVITSVPVQAMCIVQAKVLGVMQMVDNGEADDKIIAVAANDPSVNHYNNIEELPKHFFDELRHFFEEYKKLENKTVKVDEIRDKTVALSIIQDAIDFYIETFKSDNVK